MLLKIAIAFIAMATRCLSVRLRPLIYLVPSIFFPKYKNVSKGVRKVTAFGGLGVLNLRKERSY